MSAPQKNQDDRTQAEKDIGGGFGNCDKIIEVLGDDEVIDLQGSNAGLLPEGRQNSGFDPHPRALRHRSRSLKQLAILVGFSQRVATVVPES